MVLGLGLKVQGLGFSVQGFVFRIGRGVLSKEWQRKWKLL